MKGRRRFSREFKLNAVELSYKRENIKELVHELGVRPDLLYRWRNGLASGDAGNYTGNGKKKMSTEEMENARATRIKS